MGLFVQMRHHELGGHHPDLLRYVGRRVGDVALTEDIVQEAFARYLAYEAKSDSTISNVGGLLRRIALNLTRDYFRRARHIQSVELSDELVCPQPNAQRQLEAREMVEIVANVFKLMPRLRREVFIRRRVHGASSREVAEALSLTVGAVDTHVARAVLDLHRALEKIERQGRSVGN